MSEQVQPKQNENENTQQHGPVLCINGCGFYGNRLTAHYCSQCYKTVKDSLKAEEAKCEAVEQALPTPAVVSPAPAPAAVSNPSPFTSSQDAATPAASSAAAEPAVCPPAKKPKKAKKNRCLECNRKTGIMGFKCRCEGNFCARHRYPHTHDCSVDVKQLHSDNLLKANPKMQREKFEKI